MKNHRRALAFDSLEGKLLLSSIHASGVHASAHMHTMRANLPPIIRAVEGAVHKMGGTHVTATPILAAPGSFTEYAVTFQIHGHTYTTDVSVPYLGPKYGPQPG